MRPSGLRRLARETLLRSRRERRDSVTQRMLEERAAHLARIEELPVDRALAKALRKEGLGRRKMSKQAMAFRSLASESSRGGAGFAAGDAVLTGVGLRGQGWPRPTLPEVALVGHSNCGKSSLLNSLGGQVGKYGVAPVNDRAGWTTALAWYAMGRKGGARLAVVDCPGYGHAVAAHGTKKRWKAEMRHLVADRGDALLRCLVLVDCQRGLCREDLEMLDLCQRKGRAAQVVLTKGDLLPPEDLARSLAAVAADVAHLDVVVPSVPVLSSHTGAGVVAFWSELLGLAPPPPPEEEAPAPKVRPRVVRQRLPV